MDTAEFKLWCWPWSIHLGFL